MAVNVDEKLREIEEEDSAISTADKTDEEKKAEARAFDGTVFDALLAAANYENNTDEHYLIRINRMLGGHLVTLLKFHIHPLTEEEVQEIRKKNTKVKRDRRFGVDRREVNEVRVRSQIIYEATDKEDREQLWNNRKAWEKLDVLNGIDIIDKVLLAGEKDRVVSAIEDISGFGGDDELEDMVKN